VLAIAVERARYTALPFTHPPGAQLLGVLS